MPCREAAAIRERYPSRGKVASHWRSGGTPTRRVEDSMCNKEREGGASAWGKPELHQVGMDAAPFVLVHKGSQGVTASEKGIEAAGGCR